MFKESFRNVKKRLFWVVAGMDYAFFAISALAIYIYSLAIANVGGLMPDSVDFLAPESVLASQSTAFQGAITTIVIYTIILCVFILFNFSFWRGMIWAKILKKKYNFKKMLRFSLLNLPYLIIFLIIMGLYTLVVFLLLRSSMMYIVPGIGEVASSLVMLPVYILIFLPIYTYLINVTNILHIKFFSTKHYIKETIKTIMDIKKLCVHLILMGIIMLIFLYIYSLPIFMAESYIGIMFTFILVVLYCTWLKLYIVKLVH
ncbi:MAG: hypothetical protein U9R08_03055 [Nanoarchaeota archaeon]|nr:hypothetical protein [Nanoarchaeota archaeon]